jgi:hypothetical protein
VFLVRFSQRFRRIHNVKRVDLANQEKALLSRFLVAMSSEFIYVKSPVVLLKG